ncbi:hypothetical protein VS877_22435, partial [Salmonella enterica subsp. enterica serovar Paratyphi A]|nr:hypothetical protein [Salmonella enterica subsp. enterica serovar Paratyphi A]
FLAFEILEMGWRGLILFWLGYPAMAVAAGAYRSYWWASDWVRLFSTLASSLLKFSKWAGAGLSYSGWVIQQWPSPQARID